MKGNIISQITKVTPLEQYEIQLIKDSFREKELSPKEYLLKAGEQCDFECYVQKGILRNYYSYKEEERITHFSKEGDWVSDYSILFTNHKSNLNIQALEKTELLIIGLEELNILSCQIPTWDKIGKLFFENKFREKEKDMERRISLSAEERYIMLLKKQPEILQRVSLVYTAQFLGIKPESLSRIRKRLSSKGIS